MRKCALLLAALLVGMMAGCGKATPTPPPSPTATTRPSPTATQPKPTTAPTAGAESGPATCVAEPFDVPVNPYVPLVTEQDHVEGPADAGITFIEYADFQ